MSKIKNNHIFTSESVSEGHPDKICDQISDAILDECIKLDPLSRVACETLTTTNLVVNAGEITCKYWDEVNPEVLARKVVDQIGYNNDELKFSSQSFEYINRIHNQSRDISQGVTKGEGVDKEQGAGDQGMMFGYADNSTSEFMPAPIAFSHRLLDELQKLRKDNSIPYLRPDSKSQVSVRYQNGIPVEIDSIVISHQTNENISLNEIQKDMISVAKEVLHSTGLITPNTKFIINPTGRFVIGGPHGDAGLTGRKIIVDTYGGVGSHGGGAFSGKDPSKVDRSAAYYARYAAKNIVASGLADKCEIQVAYAIGISEPLSINIDTFGTSSVDEKNITEMLKSSEIFDFKPSNLIDDLQLLHPSGWCYQDTASYGHFGRDKFPWEKTDKIDQIVNALE